MDELTWQKAHNDDLWVFDKLILSRKLGYICGAKGCDVPKAGNYIIRPCINLLGMGIGSKIKYIKKETEDILEDGMFWCEIFKGRHLSVDYYKGKQVLCVEGFKSNIKNTKRWNMWKKVENKIAFPNILKTLKGNYDWINVEFIGEKLIEVHLRRNPDFEGHNSSYAIPVWKGQKIKPKEDQIFIESQDASRLGFYIEKSLK